MNKRILFIIDNLKIGGAERVFKDIVEMCNLKFEFDVLLVTQTREREFKLPNNIRIFELKRKNKYSIKTYFLGLKIIRNYDILHVHMRHTYLYIRFLNFLNLNNRNKVILHDHIGVHINKKLPFLFAGLLKPDLYIGVSRESCNWAQNIWKIPENRTFLFTNLPDLKFLEIFENAKKIKTQTTSLKFVYLGNIKRGKNQLFAIDLCKKLDVELTIIGVNQDVEYYKEVNDNLDDKISLIENCTAPESILPNYDFALMVSKNESGPLVLLEYLLCGVPFIAYKTGGISDILCKYFPEYFIDSFDQRIWLNKISQIISCPPIIEREKLNMLLKTEFNRENYLSRLISIYEA
jgi:glycosyltransferase involved in cell wall biosynthesis